MTPLFRIVVRDKRQVYIEQNYNEDMWGLPYHFPTRVLAGPFITANKAKIWLKDKYHPQLAERYEVVYDATL